MGDCTLTTMSKVGQSVKAGPDNPSQAETYLVTPSDSYGGPGVGDGIDVSDDFTYVYSATIKGRVAITDVDLAYEIQVPSDNDPEDLLLRATTRSSGEEKAAETDLSGDTFILEVEGCK